jgi:hypothetical protein
VIPRVFIQRVQEQADIDLQDLLVQYPIEKIFQNVFGEEFAQLRRILRLSVISQGARGRLTPAGNKLRNCTENLVENALQEACKGLLELRATTMKEESGMGLAVLARFENRGRSSIATGHFHQC